MIKFHCGKLEIVHKGNYINGYPTYLLLDGKYLNAYRPGAYEKVITLKAVVDQPLTVLVETGDGEQLAVLPKEFDFTLGELRVVIRPDRNPCATFINGIEIKVRCLRITFREGEVPWVSMTFLAGEPVQADSTTLLKRLMEASGQMWRLVRFKDRYPNQYVVLEEVDGNVVAKSYEEALKDASKRLESLLEKCGQIYIK